MVGLTGMWSVLRPLLGRLGEAALTLFVIMSLSFFLVRFAPGSPFDEERPLPDAVKARLEARYGLDRPLLSQYLTTMGSLARFEFGESLAHPGEDVMGRVLTQALPVSMELGLWGFAVALTFGLGLSLLTLSLRRPWASGGVKLLSQLGIAVPVIVTGPLLIELFAVRLGWFPPGGFHGAASRVLPALALGIVYGAVFYRLLLGGLEASASARWMLMLGALGVRRRRLVLRHALPGSLTPLVSYLGPALSSLLTGSFVVERVFNIHGLSVHFIDAAANRDYPVILAVVLVYAVLLVGLNLLADVIHLALDPRLRHAR